jgi:nucleoside triphosphatase
MAKQEFPQLAVGGLIVNKGMLFLVKSHKWGGKFTIPAGKVELGESMEEALRREVKEETGLRVEVKQLLFVQEMIYDKAFWKKKHFIFAEFLCTAHDGEIRLNGEAQEYVWVKPEKAVRMDLEPYTKSLVKEYLKTLKK